MNYCSDIMPLLTPHLGNDTAGQDISGRIVQFTGYLITDRAYAKFRRQVCDLIHEHMEDGYGGVDE